MITVHNHGVLLLDKREGISSARAIAEVKRLIKPERIGHAGTLDPMATGLLVCLIGSATRFASYAAHGRKIYSGTIRFGIVTDSDDITGTVLEERRVNFSEQQLLVATQSLTGSIAQVPPRVSAIKINGQRSYDLARAGSQHQMTARNVQIFRFELHLVSDDLAQFVVECSGGTYIRSLARDLGELLNCGGSLASLRREASAPFSVSDAVTIEGVTQDAIRDVRELLPTAHRVQLSDYEISLANRGDERLLQQLRERVFNGLDNNVDSIVLLTRTADGPTVGSLVVKNGDLKFGPMLR